MSSHPLNSLRMTYDLSCALGELGGASRRYTLPRLLASDRGRASFDPGAPTTDLAVAAVAFTIQLAIEAGHDPGQMRALERELISSLRPDPPA